MTQSAAVNMVAHQRSTGALPGLSLSNEEIAQRVQDHARLADQASEHMTDRMLLSRILEETQGQTRLLSSIRTMIAWFWVLVIVAVLLSFFQAGMF